MSTSMTLTQFLSGAGESAAAGTVARARTGRQGSTALVFGALQAQAGEFSGVRYQAPADYVVRELRGDKMRTVSGVFDEFAAAFQFPYYFGENKDAFDECLRDLDEFVGTAPGYVAAIRDADQLLADEPDQLAWFTDAISDSANGWARRGAVFRIVLQHNPTGLKAEALTL